ncbi:unnamed protein product, partial [Allacma fusca]
QRLLAREFLLKEYNLVAPSPPPNDSELLQRFNERPHTSQAKFPFLQQMKESFVRELDDFIPGAINFKLSLTANVERVFCRSGILNKHQNIRRRHVSGGRQVTNPPHDLYTQPYTEARTTRA